MNTTEQFFSFLESLTSDSNKSLIESVKVGYMLLESSDGEEVANDDNNLVNLAQDILDELSHSSTPATLRLAKVYKAGLIGPREFIDLVKGAVAKSTLEKKLIEKKKKPNNSVKVARLLGKQLMPPGW
jgi:hypothetical protein